MRAACALLTVIFAAVGAASPRSVAARSSLERRTFGQQCSSAADCWPDAHGDTTCQADGQCSTVCDTGYEFSSGYCHMSAPNCPAGQFEFMGFCVNGPAQSWTVTACATTNDCEPTTISNAYDACETGLCTVRCMTGYDWDGRTCVKTPFLCTLNKDCAPGTLESRLLGKCSDLRKCYATCEPGYIRSGLRCVVAPQACTDASNCKPCQGGSSACNNSQCSYKCDDSTNLMSCDANGCRCSPAPKQLSACSVQNPCGPGQQCYYGVCKSTGAGPTPP